MAEVTGSVENNCKSGLMFGKRTWQCCIASIAVSDKFSMVFY
jgi:hypothetical protein